MKWSFSSRFGLVSFLIAACLSLDAQELFLWQRDTTFSDWHSVVLGSAQGDIGSDYLDNAFVNRLAFGGKIQNGQIEDAAKDIRGSGRLGGSGLGLVELYVLKDTAFGSPHLGYTAAIGERAEFHSYLSEEAFRLGFQGNSAFAGQEKEIVNLTSSLFSWSKIGFGIFHKHNWSYIRVNLLMGNQLQSFDGGGTFYTSQLGDTVSFSYDAEYIKNTSTKRWTGGVGAGLDAALRFPLENDKGYVQLRLDDVGFIQWDGQTETVNGRDSSFTFTGFNIPDLLNIQSEDTAFPKLADTLLTDPTTSPELMWLPPTADVSLWGRIKGDHFYRLGMKVKPLRGYRPELSAAYIHALSPNVYVNVDATYGGYRGFRLGAGMETIFSGPRTWYGGIKVSDVPGMFLDTQKGRAVWLSIGHIFTRKPER